MPGAVSIKSNLTGGELEDTLLNLASIPPNPALNPKFVDPSMLATATLAVPCMPYKIVFAYEGLGKAAAAERLNAFYNEHTEIPETRRADIIIVNRTLCIVNSGPMGTMMRANNANVDPNRFVVQTGPNITAFAFMYLLSMLQQYAHIASGVTMRFGSYLNKMPFETTPSK